ncbi:hypothetical protein MFLAVUS_005882 [Mucor flavus]|uniref:Distal membrane-arm assembly complex protein 1-like domain-containing protein n=1 Tax=Mucor flavus TaxID=439312 RepID=A0ABP9YZX9_9FUNG
MINKITNTLSGEEKTTQERERVYEDCLTCKLTGALAFGGLGAYALREATVVNKLPGRSKTAVGLGVAGVGKVNIHTCIPERF